VTDRPDARGAVERAARAPVGLGERACS